MPPVSIVVLNWNGWRDTIECLESLSSFTERGEAGVVVVDNGSSDDSVSQLRSWMTKQPRSDEANVLLEAEQNLGYAAGNNIGIRLALSRPQCEFVWLLNNDTRADPESLPELLRCARAHNDVGAFGSTIADYWRPDITQCAGGARYNALTTLNRSLLAGMPLTKAVQHEPVLRLDYISGAAMFLRAQAVKRVGLLDETFFLYFEELDYARRLTKAGYSIAWCPDSIIFHKGGSSAGSRSSGREMKSQLSELHSNRSALIYARRASPRLFPLIALTRFVLKLLNMAIRGEWYLFRPLLQGFSAGLRRTS